MLLENLEVRRMTVHEVFRRRADKRPISPAYATELEHLSVEASVEFRARVTEALSAEAKSLKMDIISYNSGSHVLDAETLIDSDDTEFLHLSQKCADRLASVQLTPLIPGGMLVVFDGTVGTTKMPFLGVIKAEMQTGFRRNRARHTTVTELLNDIFLTKATRLYKVGLMLLSDPPNALPYNWTALVFDNNITQSHRESAAQYFYEGFLGCTFPSDGAYETGRFFDLTRDFVGRSNIDSEQKRDLNDALYTFVKTDKGRTFTAADFSEKYLTPELHDEFLSFLNAKHFPLRAIVRDISRMGSKLRRRRFRFGADVELFVSPEAIDQKRVKIGNYPRGSIALVWA